MEPNPIACIIVDVDGTLADPEHRIHLLPGNQTAAASVEKVAGAAWQAFFAAAHADKLNEEIALLATAMNRMGIVVFLCTGRPEAHRDVTERWLSKHGVAYRGMLMRADGDFRPDHEVKREMLAVIRDAGYRVLFAVEDRASVTAMWRAEGVRCLQVCEGNY